jgi:hypothetical protein
MLADSPAISSVVDPEPSGFSESSGSGFAPVYKRMSIF